MGAVDTALRNKMSQLTNSLRDGGLSQYGTGPENTAMNFNQPSNTINELFRKTGTTYSGTDCTVVAVYNDDLIVLGNVATITYSVYREKNPVRTLGHIYPKNFVYGSKTIAGSIVFVTFDNHPLHPLLKYFNARTEYTQRYTTAMPDDIPPFDILLVFQNEYGAESVIRLYGVELVQEGAVFSINDIYSENTMQFICKDMDPMISGTEKGSTQHLMYLKMLQGKIVDFNLRNLLEYRKTLEARIHQLKLNIDYDYMAGRGSVKPTLRYRNAVDKLTELEQQKQAAYDLGYTSDEISSIINNIDKTQEDVLAAKNSKLYNARQNRQASRDSAREQQKLLDSLILELSSIDATIDNYERNNLSTDMNMALQTPAQLDYI